MRSYFDIAMLLLIALAVVLGMLTGLKQSLHGRPMSAILLRRSRKRTSSEADATS
jgi:hypothetical protein